MKNGTSTILLLLFMFFISCENKKDVIEIYLTKNKVESYDGVPLRTAIKDTAIIKQVLESYKEEIRIDTINDKPIYMGHFLVGAKDLEEKPFINDSEILGLDFKNSQIYFSETVSKKIYNAIPQWRKTNYFGKQFALCHNGKIVLSGYLFGSMSSYWSNTYQIRYHNFPAVKRKNGIKAVAFTITDSLNFENNNLKKNIEFYNTFKNRLID
ncbi:hypothetical protein HYN48_13180 [Flavobacterium magnum]|uniref:Lipoprotein n=1 Tax=Flavobacterium magnum TaxID=2162713 RepID=A0A2S0RJQ7_9FLAO|nr:hypothetical protein [Flavobacterium magnum]AWA30952.1 hypothetical protein HYN48_13180 [Flavobacterium magnum]